MTWREWASLGVNYQKVGFNNHFLKGYGPVWIDFFFHKLFLFMESIVTIPKYNFKNIFNKTLTNNLHNKNKKNLKILFSSHPPTTYHHPPLPPALPSFSPFSLSLSSYLSFSLLSHLFPPSPLLPLLVATTKELCGCTNRKLKGRGVAREGRKEEGGEGGGKRVEEEMERGGKKGEKADGSSGQGEWLWWVGAGR